MKKREEQTQQGGARRVLRQIHCGIRARTLLCLAAIFVCSTIFLYGIADRQIRKNREQQIGQELQNIRDNTQVYVRQLLILNGANNDEASFRRIADQISGELNISGAEELAVCSGEGEILARKDGAASGWIAEEEGTLSFTDAGEDLTAALGGTAAYTLDYAKSGELKVILSMPVQVAGKNVGLIRCRLDYTDLLAQGRQTEGLILRTAAAVFAAAFLIIALLLNQILKPVGRLTKVSRQMILDLDQSQINTELLAELADSNRQDEIGELSRNFSDMLERTGAYIGRIEDDRNRIEGLLESRQAFYNNVTHELKTPLTTIQGFAQILEDDGGKDLNLLKKGLMHILHESGRLHRMVLELLEMGAKEEPGRKLPVSLNALIASVAEAMEIRANRYGFHIRLELEGELVTPGHEERLRQVFINLLDNAVKYGETGTRICVAGKAQEEGIRVTVENRTARPLSEKELSQIFEPFYRADKEYSRELGSAGLGLPLCRKIMRDHGGRIWAEGDGGSVRFVLVFSEADKE